MVRPQSQAARRQCTPIGEGIWIGGAAPLSGSQSAFHRQTPWLGICNQGTVLKTTPETGTSYLIEHSSPLRPVLAAPTSLVGRAAAVLTPDPRTIANVGGLFPDLQLYQDGFVLLDHPH